MFRERHLSYLREVKMFFTIHLILKTTFLFHGSKTAFGTMFLARLNEKTKASATEFSE